MIKKTTFSLFSSLAVFSFFGLSAMAQPYVNGNLSSGATSNNGTVAPAGYTWSEVQNDTGNATESNGTTGVGAMYNNALTTSLKISDDFTVPVGQTWNITSFDFFGYQTGYVGVTIPIDALRVEIWNGDPSVAGSAVVFGNMTANVLNTANSVDALMYRTPNTLVPTSIVPGTTRKIWKFNADATVSLPTGTYWVVYQVHAANDASVFFPASVVSGARTQAGWNAQQKNELTSTWTILLDGGNPAASPDVAVDFPFQINYTSTLGVNENALKNFAMYPVPAKDVCNFSLVSDIALSAKMVQLFDIKGAKVFEQVVSDSNSNFSINVSSLSKGIYTVKLLDKQNTTIYSNKLIKE
jgi:hypothetical protein